MGRISNYVFHATCVRVGILPMLTSDKVGGYLNVTQIRVTRMMYKEAYGTQRYIRFRQRSQCVVCLIIFDCTLICDIPYPFNDVSR